MATERIDTTRDAETPEGVVLVLRAAGPLVRSFAWLIDAIIRALFYLGLVATLPSMGNFGVGILLLVLFFVEWFYPVLFEIFMNGATPGKAILGLRVTGDDGLPVSWFGSLTRNILRTVDFLPFLYGTGLISMLMSRNFQRLGDMAAGTLVVYTRSLETKTNLPVQPAVRLPADLDGDEQHAIVEYARRLPRMSTARADELADILKPWLGERANRKSLVGMASTIVGGGEVRE